MIHKIYINNYENDFQKLAEEIGDLRYDALEEFLKLLSEKIKKDGQKDEERGRKKLAKSLKLAAENLEKSAEAINIAWEISEPFMFPKDKT